jgi:hypothetical protein
MASSSSPSTRPLAPPSPEAQALDDEDDAAADLPMTMAASVVLEHLPKDAHQALETAGALEQEKGTHYKRNRISDRLPISSSTLGFLNDRTFSIRSIFMLSFTRECENKD